MVFVALESTSVTLPPALRSLGWVGKRCMSGRTIAIGDIHGCSAALAVLLDAIGPHTDDRIVTLGDHIDRGPDSRGVIERFLDLSEAAA